MNNMLRPGGLSLTQKMLSEISLNGKKIIDIGCGSGATVNWLRGQGIEAYGFDCSIQSNKADWFCQANATALPLANQSVDISLMECSLSTMDQPNEGLCECYRVLKPSGYLIMSDLFAHGQPIVCNGILGQIRKWETILAMTENVGFDLRLFQEEETILRSYFAQLLFESPKHGFESLGINREELKRANSSYFFAIFST